MGIKEHAQKRENANNKILGVMTPEKKKRLGVKKEILEEVADAYQYLTYYLDTHSNREEIEYAMFLLTRAYNHIKNL